MNYFTEEQKTNAFYSTPTRAEAPSQPVRPPVSRSTDFDPENIKKRKRYESSPDRIPFDSIHYAVPANDGGPSSGVYLMPDLHYYPTLDDAILAWRSQLPLSREEQLFAHRHLVEELGDNPELRPTLNTLAPEGLDLPPDPHSDQLRELSSRARSAQEELDAIRRKEEEEAAKAAFEAQRREGLRRDIEAYERARQRAHEEEERFRAWRANRVTTLTPTQQAAKADAELKRPTPAQIAMARVRAAKKGNNTTN